MGVLQLGAGIAIGFGIAYFLSNKNNSSKKEINISDNNDNSKYKRDLEKCQNELESTENSLKKMRDERDYFDIKVSDSEIDLKKVKNKNSNLAKQIENLKTELEEYNTLYNAKKDEIVELKKQLNK